MRSLLPGRGSPASFRRAQSWWDWCTPLVAMDLPGPGTVFTEQQWVFPAPVYIGDTISVEGRITEWRESRNRGEMEFVVVNQEGVEVLRGSTGVYRAVPVI